MADEDQRGHYSTCPECGEVLDVSSHAPYSKVSCPSCDTAIRVRQNFNHFVIEGLLGEGGMSRVFRARDTTLGRAVALKILHPQFTANEELTSQFEKEARLTASISHPNVVKVYSVGSDQDYYYIAMELLEGRSLEDLIANVNTEGANEEPIIDIAVQVAEGLRAAYQTGLIHRDIKPGNILITSGGVAKIVDFGLALVAGGDVDESSAIWATPYYVPPEKLNDEPEDVRSDIYSLGATLFHALTGHPPFDADTTSLEELREMKSRRVTITNAPVTISPETSRIIDRMIERRPEDRYAGYDELIGDLKAANSLLGESETVEAARSEPYSQRLLAAAAAIFFVVAAYVIYQSYWADDRSGGEVDKFVLEEELPPVSGSKGGATLFIEARDFLVEGKFSKAAELFEQVIDRKDLPPVTRSWAIYNQGLCALLRGDDGAARESFGRLDGSGIDPIDSAEAEVAQFFNDAGERLRRELPVMLTVLEAERDAGELRAMGWLAYGLKNWENGRFDEAMVFLDAFLETEPPVRLEWINRYKPLVERYQREAAVVEQIPRPRSNLTLDEVDGMLESFDDIEKKLRLKGRSVALFEDRKARAVELQSALRSDLRAEEQARLAAEARAAEEKRTEEMVALQELIDRIEPMGAAGNFAGAVRELSGSRFTDGKVRQLQSDQKRMWTAAASFVESLIEDLNRGGYEGEIRRIEGPPLNGKISAASASEIRVSLEFGETTLPFSTVSREGMLLMARLLLDDIADEAERKNRSEQLIFFAQLSGDSEVASSAGTALAGEDEEFARFWARLRDFKVSAVGNES